MTPHELRERTKSFAIAIIRFSSSLPRTDEGRVIRTQLVRAGTAIGANYRAVCRSRSNRDFIAKLGIAIEEADETSYWLEIVADAKVVKSSAVHALLAEADELTRIFVSSRQTARRNAKPNLEP
jgi:four helix bundle protein